MQKSDKHRYDDIIDLPHHVSNTRPHMSLIDRAAQFSPFAALTGHGAAIQETARLTEEHRELSENSQEILNRKIQILQENLSENPEITFVYFCPDDRKEGGAYLTVSGCAKKIDEYKRLIILNDKTVISIEQIVEMDGEIFDRRG